MKSYKKMISKGILTLVLAASATVASAQFSVGTDIVSSYVWRGCKQDLTHTPQSPNIQPYVSYAVGGLTLGAWGSTSLTGTVKEVDLYATYAFTSNLALTLTDYNWGFANPKGYFNYSKGTDHIFEATLAYAGTESLPLSASLNTMFAGSDTTSSGKQAFSTYVELGYQLTDNAKVFVGGLLNASLTYGIGAGVTNVGLKVTKSFEITEKCCLPIYGIVGVNPVAKDAFLVLGVTL